MILACVMLLPAVSCSKKTLVSSPVIGHWGCEKYVSCRIDALGHEQWDTLCFEAVTGGEYELFFNADGSGLLKLNNSPALIKEFSCKYEYDTVNQTITVTGDSWLYALYGSLFLDAEQAVFDVENFTDSLFVASWTNRLSEPQPFFERFFVKRIEP